MSTEAAVADWKLQHPEPRLDERACPVCRAQRGEPCVTRTGSGMVLEKPHSRRIDILSNRRSDWQIALDDFRAEVGS